MNYNIDSSIFKIEPEYVFNPKNIKEIQDILNNYKNKSISIRAGGTCMSGGSLTDSVLIDITNLKGIKINTSINTVDIYMGEYYRDLEKEALKYNLFFPPYTSSKDVCGIGGMLGNNASGEKSIRYGATVDNVLSVDVLLSDNNIYTFKPLNNNEFLEKLKLNNFEGYIYKNIFDIYKKYHFQYTKKIGDIDKCASGYRLEKIYNTETGYWNLTPLFIGSQGTLGIILKARLKLEKLILDEYTLALSINDIISLPNILNIIMDNNPISVETFDINTFNMSKKFFNEEIYYVQNFFNNNEKLIILCTFDNMEILKKVKSVLQENNVKNIHIVNDKIKSNYLWNIRRASYKVFRDYKYEKESIKAVPCIEDIIVPIQHYSSFLPKLINILESNNIKYGYHGHIGDGSIRVIPIIDFENKKQALCIIDKLMKDVFLLVKKEKGNISADHSDGLIRSSYLRDFYEDEIYENVIIAIKNIFDKNNIFNKGKKTNSKSILELENNIK